MFYITAPFLIRWLRRDERAVWLVGQAALLSGLGVGLVILLARLPLADQFPDTLLGAEQTYLMHFSLFGHLPDFLAGMVVGFYYLRREEFGWIVGRANGLIWGSSVGMAAAIILLDLTDDAVAYGEPLNRLLGFGVALFSATLILGLAGDEGRRHPVSRLLGSRVMVYLGATSYVLYLVQLTEPLQWLYWVFLGEWVGVDNRFLRAILLYFLAVPISAMLYEWVERPSHRWLVRRFRPKLAQV